ncbi:hypothetical protein, variant [Cryptococcus amylolentus CBS 6039]|uniref:Uncharacterized protein n=2 Tax=Cryptococcus amylolentus TaxID=104669 RepID=A0A1E3HIC1_9TREE|nr:hypothetical protein L202_06037 [Cryptococcus amylolentus CBS 6039]XP_018991634.1 hypothetical protein, variant [Cryptococcus amylolentus CBS 6039]ODN76102.1 hypothetical protein L202_06037 [Cryptococcus amylolentus CBS 6039]ODN76103.1 hypothetical protein, variant [Cryptococcus amylolentus CBS 6039]ODN97193.1 hypothetical protein I350_08173 [Cryptococcus amylolentus CBS 6273]
MSGFVLGTGSGVLAAAAVYYTLSTHLTATTASLRSDLNNSSALLNHSFDPVTPPAQAALIGPSSSSPAPPPFSQVLRQRWNDTLTSFVGSARQTDWQVIGQEVVEAGRGVVEKFSESGTAEKAEKKVDSIVDAVREKVGDVLSPAPNAQEKALVLKKPLEGIDLHKDKVGTVGGVQEELKRKVAEAKGRMV